MADGSRAGRERGSTPSDNTVMAFRTEASRTQGRLVRLGGAVDDILRRHDYPDAVSEVLGEALALTAMLGSVLRPNGKLILQTKSDGPLGLIAVNFFSPGRMRALATFNSGRLAELSSGGRVHQGRLLGSGHLALTIDPGGEEVRTQGIVALANQSLTQAAHAYFHQSEQIPTFIRLAVARHSAPGSGKGWHWRAGGLLLQQLPSDVREAAKGEDIGEGLLGEEQEDWQRARLLASTVEDHELTDPTLAPERLLYRLFHEEGVRAFTPLPIEAHCGCSRERVNALLRGFGTDELSDMREPDGGVTVTCEYCNAKYRFTSDEVAGFSQ
jgi:molecular chaperone Hsp33